MSSGNACLGLGRDLIRQTPNGFLCTLDDHGNMSPRSSINRTFSWRILMVGYAIPTHLGPAATFCRDLRLWMTRSNYSSISHMACGAFIGFMSVILFYPSRSRICNFSTSRHSSLRHPLSYCNRHDCCNRLPLPQCRDRRYHPRRHLPVIQP